MSDFSNIPSILSLIEEYLNKHDDDLKCGHKKGDPNHIENG